MPIIFCLSCDPLVFLCHLHHNRAAISISILIPVAISISIPVVISIAISISTSIAIAIPEASLIDGQLCIRVHTLTDDGVRRLIAGSETQHILERLQHVEC